MLSSRERNVLLATAALAIGVPTAAVAWVDHRTDQLADHLGTAAGVPARIGAVEIAPREGFYDYQNKYTRGATDYFVPPRLSPERYRGVLAQALRAHLALGCAGATRVDMMVSDSGNEYVLEVNTVPGLTPTSLLPKIADAAGISFGELCEAMLAGAALSSRRGRGERRVVQRAYVGDDRRETAPPTH